MFPNRTFLILSIALAAGLVGGCTDRVEIEKLTKQVSEQQQKIDALEKDKTYQEYKIKNAERDAELERLAKKEDEEEKQKIRAVTIASACEAIINLCPDKMTEWGRHYNDKEGVAPEVYSIIWWWAILFKYVTAAGGLIFLYLGITLVHGLRLKKQIAALAGLKQEIEENKGLQEKMLAELHQQQARLKEIKEEQDANLDRYEFYINEAKENLDEQEREVEKLNFEIEKLQQKRDALKQEVQQVQDALDAFAPTKRKK